jgi:hypothetical protein
MSYNLTLHCGCIVYVSCHPKTHVAHTRIIQTRGTDCTNRKHDIGARLYLWETLPDRGSTGDDEREVCGALAEKRNVTP